MPHLRSRDIPSSISKPTTADDPSTTAGEPLSPPSTVPPRRRSLRLSSLSSVVASADDASPSIKRPRGGETATETAAVGDEVVEVKKEGGVISETDLETIRILAGELKEMIELSKIDLNGGCLRRPVRSRVAKESSTEVVTAEVNKEVVDETTEEEESGGGSRRRGRKVRRFSWEEKGKSKIVDEVKIEDEELSCNDDDDVEGEGMAEREEESLGRFTMEEKGKGKAKIDEEEEGGEKLRNDEAEGLGLGFGMNVEDWDMMKIEQGAMRTKRIKDQFKNIARKNASKYAHFSVKDEDEGRGEEEEEENVEGGGEEAAEGYMEGGLNVEDWPGPFSTAMKIIRDRSKNVGGRQGQNSTGVEGGKSLISWIRKEKGPEWRKRSVPSLQNLCLKILAENVDCIGSLKYVPDVLRHRLCQLLCDTRRMNAHFFSLLLDGCPAEIRVTDCSWLEEEEFENSIKACDTSSLTVLQLDLCGHCISDPSLLKAIAPKGLPALTTISLKGACRISDAGIKALVSAAPVLRSLNLSQCSLLTDVGIKNIADSLGSIVHELYLDDCDTLKAKSILPSLKRLERLEVLSLRGIGGVTDKFIRNLIASNGRNMKELILANCVNLTDSSLKVIAETCSQLCVIDLSYLRKLTDVGMAYLTNGCPAIQDLRLCRNAFRFIFILQIAETCSQLCVIDLSYLRKLTDVGMAYLTNGCPAIQDLRLCRNAFSDDAIAAFLETSGHSLKDLSLNNITKVGENTTLSLAWRCKHLEFLDLSWCRSLTDEALGLIADSCMSLRLLKIFGCTQITGTFIDGHSNPNLHVVGMKLTPILEHIKRPDFQQGPLHYSAVPSS